MICKAISTQFIEDNLIAIFELTIQDNEIRVVKEIHYQLVSANEISDSDLEKYKQIGVEL